MNTHAKDTTKDAATTSSVGVAPSAQALTVDRQRDILLGSIKAYLLRHGRNEMIASDVAFNDMSNAVRLVEDAAKA